MRKIWPARWLELSTLAAAIVVVIVSAAWRHPGALAPLLAVPPALAGIGALTPRRPLGYGAVALAAAIVVAVLARDAVAVVTVVAVAVAAGLGAFGTVLGRRQTQRMVNVTSAAEAAQRAVLRPLPDRMGPLDLRVVYLAAAADAQVGGDLYEVTTTPFGIRIVIGDVRGKGLGAVEVAADVLGMFREVAHEVHTLAELARRIDAGLTRRWGEFEEFVTALFAEIDPVAGRLTIYSCGHPPPMLISPAGVSALEVPAPAPPLGLLTLADCSGAGRTLSFTVNGQLLLYTDGVTEARDQRREFYPLEKRLTELRGSADGKLLERLRDDLLRYAGAPLGDDVAMLLVRAPDAWA